MADEEIESGGQTDEAPDTGDVEDTDPAVERDEATPADRPQRQGGEKGGETRKERRANRMREATEARAAAEKEREEWRQRHGQLEQQLRELQTQTERDRASRQTNDKNSERRAKVQSLRDQAKMHLQASAAAGMAKDTARADAEWNKYQELLDQAEDERREIWAEQERERIRGEFRQSMPNQQAAAALAGIDMRFPWVVSNAEARDMADTRLTYLLGRGRPLNRETVLEAMTWTAKTLRLPSGGGVSDASRQRYVGTGQRDGEADDGGSSRIMSADDVRNNIAYKRMAQGAYPQLEADQAYARWAKEIGSKLNGTGA